MADRLEIAREILEKLGVCPCWEGQAFKTLRDYLEYCDTRTKIVDSDKDRIDSRTRWELSLDPHIKGMAYLINGCLTSMGLINHRFSARHSWLTPKGEEFLDFLKSVNTFHDLTEILDACNRKTNAQAN